MKTLIFLSISCFLILSCNQSLINIKQTNSNYPIVFRVDKKKSYIYLIEFPLVFEINKSSFLKKIELSLSPSYRYYRAIQNKETLLDWSSGIMICKFHNGNLEEYDFQKNISIKNFKKEYIFYTVHRIYDTTQAIQKLFSSYIAKMKALGKDTLHIASIQELKKTNPELLNTFLKGDSIELTFYYDKLYHNIKLPVEIK